VTSKGYGPRASHNFYSAPVLVRSPVDRTPLLRALAEVDLLPDDTILMAETVARGVELRNGLAMARLRAAALPEPEPWGESACLQQMRSGPLSAAVLESRREAYREKTPVRMRQWQGCNRLSRKQARGRSAFRIAVECRDSVAAENQTAGTSESGGERQNR
jgi:hypothetical protein